MNKICVKFIQNSNNNNNKFIMGNKESYDVNYADMDEVLMSTTKSEIQSKQKADLVLNKSNGGFDNLPEVITYEEAPIEIRLDHFKKNFKPYSKSVLEDARNQDENFRLTTVEHKKRNDIRLHQQEIGQKKYFAMSLHKSRTESKKQQQGYELELKELIRSLSNILKDYISEGDTITTHSKATLLFNDAKYMNKKWNISIFTGFAPTIPIVRYHTFREKYRVITPDIADIYKFVENIYSKVRPPLECAVIALIYLEKLLNEGVALTSFNWRPILYTAFLIASKFWEDVNVWNVDYAEKFDYYSLAAIMKLESAFLGICKYDMFVTAELYAKYFFAIRKRSMAELFESIQIHSDSELKSELLKYANQDNDS